MDIELRTHSPHKALVLRGLQRYGKGPGFGCTLDVRSGHFHGSITFAVEDEPAGSFLRDLDDLDRQLKGAARLKPVFEEPYLEFEVLNTGRVRVRGYLAECSELTQELRFEFETDQTVLRPFLSDLHHALDS